MDETISDDELFEMLLEYLVQKQQGENPIYANKRLSGLSSLDSLSMMIPGNKHYKLGRRRRSISDLY
ncbi:hypothetical protein [Salmonella sp. s54395]|uniref:hypothetical protein n=1 Tax=Salmonella sp. s54395 TaxID=3159664 RepID=UPI0039808271